MTWIVLRFVLVGHSYIARLGFFSAQIREGNRGADDENKTRAQIDTSFLRAYRKNVSNDSGTLRRLQTRAMRHIVHDLGPILARIFPDRRQGVTLNAAMNEQHSAAFQLRKLFRCQSNRRRVVRGFATDEHANRKRGENRRSHFKTRFRKLSATENRPRPACPSLAPARSRSRTIDFVGRKRSVR